MSETTQDPVRYAIIGLGRAGWNIHVKALRDRPDAKIVAVVDPVAERREQAVGEFGCKAYDTLAKALKQADVEVVVIATPSVQHGPESKRAMKAGKHVVVEKPMALSVAEADSMIKVANETGRKLFVHQNYRFYPEFLHMQEVIASGLIGRVYHIRNYISNFTRRNDWQTLAKNGGGVLNNTCPHFIDQLLQLIGGRVTTVVGDLQQIASAGDVEDHVKVFLRADNGATADMEISNAQSLPHPLPKWIVCGTHGTLVSDGKQSTLRWYDPTQVRPLEVREGPAADRKYGNDDVLPWQEKQVPSAPTTGETGNFYDNVYNVLRNGAEMRITPESVREVIRVIALARKGTTFPGTPRSPKSSSTGPSHPSTQQEQQQQQSAATAAAAQASV